MFSAAVINTAAKATQGKSLFYLPGYTLSLEETKAGTQGAAACNRNQQRNTVYWFAPRLMLFLIKHRCACPWIVMSAVGWTLLRNQKSRKCPHRHTHKQKLLN